MLKSELFPHRRSGKVRAAWLVGWMLAAILTALRVVQLAVIPADQAERVSPSLPLRQVAVDADARQESHPTSKGAAKGRNGDAVDAELKRLYTMCPESAAISWDAVVTSPEAAAALLPPLRETADRVPTIQYPYPVGVTQQPGPTLRVATAKEGEWLVDPKEWLGESVSKPAKEAKPAPAQPATSPSPNEPASEPTLPAAGPAKSASSEAAPTDITPVESQSEEWKPPQPRGESLPQPQSSESPPATKPLFSAPPSEDDHAAPATEPVAPAPLNSPTAPAGPAGSKVDPHLELFAKNTYPAARECAICHEEIYNDWCISAHAYATVSPMFQKFEQKLNDLSQGTVGYFCMRCHAPVATAMCASRAEPIWNLPEVAREGVTCIVCHRVKYMYGKSNGERRIEPGPIFAPVYGGIGGDGVAEVIHKKDHFKVKTSPDEKGPGQDIHLKGVYFEQFTRSEFCASCHQVAVYPGIKLEVVWEQYRASPACKKGIQCQDCHMGRVPGLPLGYDCGPVAKIGDKTVNDHRRKSNHVFYGPNYPIAHPGVFPFNLKANRWTIEDWLAFDWRGGWGTKEFEDAVDDGKIACEFPKVWAEADDRYDAREIINDNLKKLERKRDIRIEVMENGSRVDGPYFDHEPCRGQDLDFHFIVTNTNEGHNLVTASLGAQPQYWANVVVIGPNGERLWETGYTDSFGDLANIHSEDVRNKRAAFDWQLMNLQTLFLITGAKGTDREFFVPVNIDVDQLPFIRPGVQPISVINHPPLIRMESQSLAPLGSRQVPYRVPGELLRQRGTYRISFRMRNRAEPPYFMRFCNATPDMLRSMNEWMIDTHPQSVEFYVR